jgi:hypothetical protein
MKESQKRARQFVLDIRAGVTDPDLLRKYGLNPKKFYLYKASALDIIAKENKKDFRQKRRINPHHVIADIRCGFDDETLMTKYSLSSREFQSVLRQIIEAKLASALELSGRLSITKSQVMDAFVEMGKAIRELD